MLAGLAIATHTTPLQWQAVLDEDPAMVATVLDLMAENTARSRHGR